MTPYEILGVDPGATDEELARAYKSLAKQYHPDLNPGDSAAAERMGQINRAYDDIRSMRQRGADPGNMGYQPNQGYGQAYGNPFDPFFTGGRTYYYTYTYRPRRGPLGMILAIMVMFFVLRMILSLFLGGYGGYYYVSPGYGPSGYYGYGYSQTIPYGNP